MSRTVEDWELSAYVDNELPAERMAEIETAAGRDPALRQHLDELLADHGALRELAAKQDSELKQLPPALARLGGELEVALDAAAARPHDRRRRFAEVPAAAWRKLAGLAAAAAIGWTAASWAAPHPDPLSLFLDEAAEVHRTAVLAPGFSHKASATVIESVSQLFAHNLTPPDLTSAGFTLSGVDIAATDTGPVAVFSYTDPEARRLSMVLSLDAPILDALGGDGAAPRVASQDGLAVSYGQRHGVAYAFVGSIPEARARVLAQHAFADLSD